MTSAELQIRDFEKEIIYSYSRSSGPGGQNVNKVNTRVELRFSVLKSECLSISEKELILQKNANKINNEGELIIVSQSERSQLKNRENVLEKFYLLLLKSLTIPKKRNPGSPTKASKEKRLESKKILSEKKQTRRKAEY